MQTDTEKHDWRGVLKDVGWPIKAAVGLVLLSGLFALVAHESSYVLAAPLALGCAPIGQGERMAAVVHPVAMEESDCQRNSPDSVGAVFDVSHFGPNPSETPERARACASIPCPDDARRTAALNRALMYFSSFPCHIGRIFVGVNRLSSRACDSVRRVCR
jgi:hypothetical protein